MGPRKMDSGSHTWTLASQGPSFPFLHPNPLSLTFPILLSAPPPLGRPFLPPTLGRLAGKMVELMMLRQ